MLPPRFIENLKSSFVSIVGVGAISALTGWLVSLGWLGSLDHEVADLWPMLTLVLTVLLVSSKLLARIGPPGSQIPPTALMISGEGWDLMATVFPVVVLQVVALLPLFLTIYLLVKYPQSAKTIIPLVFVVLGILAGLA
jgi:hypothetical protein